jgi:TolB protein
MLTRALRLADKSVNMLLRVVTVAFEGAAISLHRWRVAIWAVISTLAFTAARTAQTGRAAVSTVQRVTAERRRNAMARKAEQAAQAARTAPDKRVIREDPLKTQNRALSLFTVVLLAALIGLVLLATNNASRPDVPRAAGQLPLTPTAAPTTPPPPTPTASPTATLRPDPLRVEGSIVYAARTNGRENLWTIGLGQTEPIRLTNTPVDDRDPAWSPDGTKIAFASRRDGNWDLYLLEVATGAVTRLTYSLGYEAAPTWSPDGRFIAYEGYEANNLDIYIISADGQGQPQRLTYHPAPDYAPAWNPGGTPPGRQIAYVSLREGNAEIYVISLDRPAENEALRLTTTPNVDEELPAWSPDGATLAYNARINGIDLVQAKPANAPNAEPITIGQGRAPAWSPSGANLLFALELGGSTTLVGGLAAGTGSAATAITVNGRVSRVSWTASRLPESLIQTGGVASNDVPLYEESVGAKAAQPPFYQFRELTGVRAPLAVLSDRVDDSFRALRESVLRATGLDFLGTLADALWTPDRLPEPGQARQSWHYTGRAFAFDRNLVFNLPIAQVEAVREDVGVNTFWRVYIRVAENAQGGQLGEPLKRLPWDFASRGGGDPQVFEQGGRVKPAPPPGYYVDLTQLAEDYGWSRLPSGRDWRSNFPSILYWQFEKRDGLGWNEAMLELYTQTQIDAFLFGLPVGGTATPTSPSGDPTRTPALRRTPTPLPPAGN